MRFGWIISLFAHVAFLFAGYIIWPHAAKELDVDSAIVPVEVVTFAEQSNVTPIAAADALPAPIPTEQGAPQELSELAPAPEAIPIKPNEPKPKTPEKSKAQPKVNFDQLALLIDRSKKSTGASQTTTSPTAKTGETPRQGFGAQSALTATERDALRAQLSKCWRAPVDMPDPARLIVRVRITLGRDGSLLSQPQLVSGVSPGDAPMRVAADNALRAVRLCAPFELPAATYDRWRDVIFTFDPREMLQ